MDKRKAGEQSQEDTEMRTEYDFSKGVRGKHHKAYHEGHTVNVRKADVTVSDSSLRVKKSPSVGNEGQL